MKKEKSIQADIEVLKRFRDTQQQLNKTIIMKPDIPIVDALTSAISWGEERLAQPKPLSKQRIEEIIISLKTEHCINPDCDRDGTPTNRCGGCWDCVLDQVLDRVAKNLAEAIYKEMNAQSNPTERSK